MRASTGTTEFEAFVSTAFPGLARFGSMLVGDARRGEDLVQAALIKVYLAWPRLDDKAAAPAYARKVMVREASRWRRRRWAGEQPTALIPEHSAPDAFGEVDERQRLLDALRSLPLNQRSVLVLRYLEQRSEAEIATLLGTSPGTVKSRAARGLAALKASGLLAPAELTEADDV